jgi:hypothetical protein
VPRRSPEVGLTNPESTDASCLGLIEQGIMQQRNGTRGVRGMALRPSLKFIVGTDRAPR